MTYERDKGLPLRPAYITWELLLLAVLTLERLSQIWVPRSDILGHPVYQLDASRMFASRVERVPRSPYLRAVWFVAVEYFWNTQHGVRHVLYFTLWYTPYACRLQSQVGITLRVRHPLRRFTPDFRRPTSRPLLVSK